MLNYSNFSNNACGPGFSRVRFSSILRTGRQVAHLAYPYRRIYNLKAERYIKLDISATRMQGKVIG